MVTLEWSLERTEGVTLVGLVVAADRPCRVQIENRLDGPVWPPRRHGQPADGWDEGTFSGCVPPDGRLTVGYATPAQPSEPPASVVSTEPVTDGDDAVGADCEHGRTGTDCVPTVEDSPAGVVRALGDPLVPRDSVPLPEPTPGQQAAGPAAGESTTAEDEEGQQSGATATADRPNSAPESTEREGRVRRSPAHAERLVPKSVRDWLAEVGGRLDVPREEADTGFEATPAVEQEPSSESACPAQDVPLKAAREVDRFALQQVRRRVESLLDRTEQGASCRTAVSEGRDRREAAVGPGER